MKENNNRYDWSGWLLAAAMGLLIVGLIVFMKSNAALPGPLSAHSTSRQVAKPDTSLGSEAPIVLEREAVEAPPADTVEVDRRPPAEAGYEDGYFAGTDDGSLGQERASYDESSRFPRSRDREVYAESYRRGYADGLRDGRDGKQFGF